MGVNWIEVSSPLRASRVNSGWIVESKSGKRINTSVVMDATGRRAWFASQLGLTAERIAGNQRVRFGWNLADPDCHDQNPEFRLQEDGWNWRAPVGHGREAWVQMRLNGTAGLDMTPRIHRKCAGPDWYLLGDAACLTTPASGNGVLRALMSGIYAVHCINTTRADSVSPQFAADTYCLWINNFWESTVVGTESPTPA
jgi:flavin-dependent dehydrogenase